MILLADSEGPDETARMRSLIWTFAGRVYQKTHFGMTRHIHKHVSLLGNESVCNIERQAVSELIQSLITFYCFLSLQFVVN